MFTSWILMAVLSAPMQKIGPELRQALATTDGKVPVIVMFRRPAVALSNGVQAETIAQIREHVLSHIPRQKFELTHPWSSIPGFAGRIGREALDLLDSDPDVVRVDLDTPGSGGLAESVPLIGGNTVHALGYNGSGVTVAVLDSGVDRNHPDLAGRILDEQCFCTNSNATGCCPNGMTTQSGVGAANDDHGHGTNVSGIVASVGLVSSVGVAPQANIIAVKVLDKNNIFSGTAQVVSGLDWIITNHPEVRIINMSMLTGALFSGYCDTTTSFTQAFASAVNTLRANGAVVFACSGNDHSKTTMGAPACVQNTISVGAVWDSNVGSKSVFCTDATTAADQVTCFSNSNSTIDLLAPGAPITSDAPGGGTSTFYGTSQASPHAAGSAAVLLAISPTLTPAAIESLLKTTGKSVTDAANGIATPRVDLLAAVTALRKDINGDGTLSVADVFYLINYLFAAGPAPIGSGDVNADNSVNPSDVFYLINYFFAGGPAPQ